MDYTKYTSAQLTAMAHAIDVIDQEMGDPTLPEDFWDILDEYLELSDERKVQFLADLTRAANVSSYAQDMDNPIDLVTPIMSDDQAADNPALFHAWMTDVLYADGNRITHAGKLWKCLLTHVSQAGWEPGVAPSLWVEVAHAGEIPEWKQPTGSHDAYMTGDKVRHIDMIWVSQYDNNVWEPGVYGWVAE